MSRRAARIDANQPVIVGKLRDIPGVSVAVTSALGKGFVDIVIGYKKRSFLVELKDPNQPPSKRVLTEAEAEFHRDWFGQVAVAETFEDCLAIIGAIK